MSSDSCLWSGTMFVHSEQGDYTGRGTAGGTYQESGMVLILAERSTTSLSKPSMLRSQSTTLPPSNLNTLHASRTLPWCWSK